VKAMLSFWKAAALGLTGYVLGSAMVIVIAQMHEDSWLSGGIIAAMSLPVAIIFFWVLWALGRFRYLRPTSAGIAVAGCVCGFYPAVCGLFPVFWFRWELAFPVAAIQFVFLALIVALFAWLDRAFGAVAN